MTTSTQSNTTDASDTTEPDPEDAIRTVLENNAELATAAYERNHGYRETIQAAIEERHDLRVDTDLVRDIVVDTNRLGLLDSWAETTSTN